MALTDGTRCAPSSDPESCGDTFRIQQFASWAASVALRFPTVDQFVVMNECNQPRFVNPQWDRAGNNQSAAICGRALAAAYDSIKAVSSADFVWGVGLSPRGNDSPGASSNSSTKPVTFIAALGAWFKAYAQKTARTRGLMDGLDFHPYPVPQTQPFAQGYADSKEASVTNLSRIYQAFYGAFNGSPQKTIGQQTGGGLPLSLNETGVQTRSGGRAAYTGAELSATSAGGVLGNFASEDYQAGLVPADARSPRVRPERRLRQHLPSDRRVRPRGLAERPLLRRPDAEAVGADRGGLARADRRRVPGHRPSVDAVGRLRAAEGGEAEAEGEGAREGGEAEAEGREKEQRRTHAEAQRARQGSRRQGDREATALGLTTEQVFATVANTCS